MNKKIILGIIISGIIFGSVGVYAGSNFYANGISVNAPTGSSLGSDANLQNSLDELYSIADKYDELNKKINSLKSDMLNEMYPVGSIYLSTSITTASDISKKFGGTWEAYGTGKTLVGVDTSNTNFNTVSKTGGSSTTTLSTSNLPSHNHSIPSLSGTAAATGSGYSIGYTSASRTTSTNGNHTHNAWTAGISPGLNKSNVWYFNFYLRDFWNSIVVHTNASDSRSYDSYGLGYISTEANGNHTHTVPDYYANSISGIANHSHSVTTKASTTGSTGSGTSFTNLPPYITVYMYKRVK